MKFASLLGTIHVTVPDVWPCSNDAISTPLLSLIQNGCPVQLRVKVTVLPALNLSVGFKVEPEELKRYPNVRLLVTLIEYELCPIKAGVLVVLVVVGVVISVVGVVMAAAVVIVPTVVSGVRNTMMDPTINGCGRMQ